MKRSLYCALSLILAAFLLLTHSPGIAQEFQINVDVKGKKGKKFLSSVKQGICDSVLDHLTFNVAGSTVPSSCNMKVKTAQFLINAEAIFEKPPVSLNLFLEIRSKEDGQIIGQKAHTVNVPKNTGDPKKLLYDETARAMIDLIPEGWKPPSGKAAGSEPVKETEGGAGESPGEGAEAEEEEEVVVVEEEEETTPVEPKQRASLMLAISAGNAKVLIDGNDIGLSPLGILEGVTVGKHEICVKKDGYKTYTGSIEVKPAGESGITRHDIILETTEKKKKKKGVAGKWWFWTILGGLVLGGAAAAVGVVYGSGGDEETDAVSFPNY